MKEKCVIYCRVSSKEQEDTGYSLDAQEELLKEYADKNNFEVVKVFKIAESASGHQVRKLFQEVLAYISKHKINALLCEKIDRLTRNLKDAVIIQDWIKDADGRAIHFVKENFVLNKETKSHENLVWDMKVAMARFYANNLSEEVKKGQRAKIASGWLPTKPPIGYKTIGDAGHKIHVVDENKAPLVREMFSVFATGDYPVERLSNEMFKRGLRTRGGYKLVRSRIAELLSDPFYVGKIRWNGQVYDGSQESLISKDIFDKVQEVVNGRAHPKYRKHEFLFKGLVFCKDCGGLITWEKQKGIIYGHCSQYRKCEKRSWHKEEDFIKIVGSEFSNLKLQSNRLAEWVKKAIQELHKTEIEHRDGVLTQLQNRQARLRQQQDTLYTDRLEGRITIDFYDEKQKGVSIELSSIVEAIRRHSDADKKYYELGMNLFELSQQADAIFTTAKPEKQRRLLKLICKEMTIEKNVLTVELTEEFNTLSQIVDNLNHSKTPEKLLSPFRIFELPKSLDFKPRISSSTDDSRPLLRR